MESYMKIKAFAELAGVSVRTMQYYDEIELLKPAYTNEHGHRFYDSASFSKMFVIQSLKNMGMSLSEIQQYVNDESFDIHTFIEAEKRRTEAEIMNLQLRLLRLSQLNDNIAKQQKVSPQHFLLYSQILSNKMISPMSQIEHSQEREQLLLDFNLKDWHNFITNLNDCFANKLTVTNEKAIQCVHYWKKHVIEANQVQEDMARLAEEMYQNADTCLWND